MDVGGFTIIQQPSPIVYINIKVPGVQIFDELLPVLSCCTDHEASNLGVLLSVLLPEVERWRASLSPSSCVIPSVPGFSER